MRRFSIEEGRQASGIRGGTKVLLVMVGLVALALGIQFFRPVLIPVLLALFVATGSQPVVDFCARRGLSLAVSGTIALVVVLVGVSAFVALLVYGVSDLSQQLPTYDAALRRSQATLATYLGQHQMARGASAVLRFDASAALVSGITGSNIASVASVLTNAALVLSIAGFLLFERTIFEKKLAAAFHFDQLHAFIDGTFSDMQQYLWIKTWMSAAVGIGAGAWCTVWNVPNAALWGLLTFALNFAPMIGSLIATIPPVAIALVMRGPLVALIFGVGLGVLHLIVGSIVEPRVMGRRLGLSPLVVLLSMLLWGFLLGPVGALLSTPLTMMFKIGVSHSTSFAWIAVLLGDQRETKEQAAARQSPRSAPAPQPGPTITPASGSACPGMEL